MDDPYAVLARAERLEQELFEAKARAERAERLAADMLRAVELLAKCATELNEARRILREIWNAHNKGKANDPPTIGEYLYK